MKKLKFAIVICSLIACSAASAQVCTKMYSRFGMANPNYCLTDADFDDAPGAVAPPVYNEQASAYRPAPAKKPAVKRKK